MRIGWTNSTLINTINKCNNMEFLKPFFKRLDPELVNINLDLITHVCILYIYLHDVKSQKYYYYYIIFKQYLYTYMYVSNRF